MYFSASLSQQSFLETFRKWGGSNRKLEFTFTNRSIVLRAKISFLKIKISSSNFKFEKNRNLFEFETQSRHDLSSWDSVFNLAPNQLTLSVTKYSCVPLNIEAVGIWNFSISPPRFNFEAAFQFHPRIDFDQTNSKIRGTPHWFTLEATSTCQNHR